MDTDSRANAEQPRLTRKVKAFAGVCISVYLCLSVVSSFQLPFLGLCRDFRSGRTSAGGLWASV